MITYHPSIYERQLSFDVKNKGVVPYESYRYEIRDIMDTIVGETEYVKESIQSDYLGFTEMISTLGVRIIDRITKEPLDLSPIFTLDPYIIGNPDQGIPSVGIVGNLFFSIGRTLGKDVILSLLENATAPHLSSGGETLQYRTSDMQNILDEGRIGNTILGHLILPCLTPAFGAVILSSYQTTATKKYVEYRKLIYGKEKTFMDSYYCRVFSLREQVGDTAASMSKTFGNAMMFKSFLCQAILGLYIANKTIRFSHGSFTHENIAAKYIPYVENNYIILNAPHGRWYAIPPDHHNGYMPKIICTQKVRIDAQREEAAERALTDILSLIFDSLFCFPCYASDSNMCKLNEPYMIEFIKFFETVISLKSIVTYLKKNTIGVAASLWIGLRTGIVTDKASKRMWGFSSPPGGPITYNDPLVILDAVDRCIRILEDNPVTALVLMSSGQADTPDLVIAMRHVLKCIQVNCVGSILGKERPTQGTAQQYIDKIMQSRYFSEYLIPDTLSDIDIENAIPRTKIASVLCPGNMPIEIASNLGIDKRSTDSCFVCGRKTQKMLMAQAGRLFHKNMQVRVCDGMCTYVLRHQDLILLPLDTIGTYSEDENSCMKAGPPDVMDMPCCKVISMATLPHTENFKNIKKGEYDVARKNLMQSIQQFKDGTPLCVESESHGFTSRCITDVFPKPKSVPVAEEYVCDTYLLQILLEQAVSDKY